VAMKMPSLTMATAVLAQRSAYGWRPFPSANFPCGLAPMLDELRYVECLHHPDYPYASSRLSNQTQRRLLRSTARARLRPTG
jgi:hypothetical protein